jgi:methylated-DNA-[protein]-cysteine S-methyltransferase
MLQCIVDTPLGHAMVQGTDRGITSIKILDSQERLSEKIPLELQNCANQLHEYFSGKRKTFELKLNPEGTEFQKNVWQHLQTIPFGKTTTYLELSRALGNEKAIRAVANANSKNPLWIVVPCHRVIGSDGSLTGYAGGLQRKAWLLHHEGAIQQQSLF